MDLIATLQSQGAQGVGGMGTVLSAGSDLMAGYAQRQNANSVAAQLRQQAIAARGASQRVAEVIDRRGQLLESRARAVAASSGGSASDPTVVNTIADIAGQSDLRRLTAIATGENEGRGLEYEASVRQRMGRTQAVTGILGAYGTLIKGKAVANAHSKYGMDDELDAQP